MSNYTTETATNPNLNAQFNKTTSQVKQEKAKGKLNEAADLAKEAASDAVSSAKVAASDAVDSAKDQAKAQYDIGKIRAQEYAHKAEEKILERPLVSVGIAFAAGLVIARLLK